MIYLNNYIFIYHTSSILALMNGKFYDMVALSICVETNGDYGIGYKLIAMLHDYLQITCYTGILFFFYS
jgi:hypothetical protein